MAKKYPVNPEKPDAEILNSAATVLRKGGIIAHPTDTVYGLAGLWDSMRAIRKIQKMKGRNETQPLSIMVGEIDQILEITGLEDPSWRNFLKQTLPAPVTLVVPKIKKLMLSYWNEFDWLGFRLPDSPLCRELVHGAGQPLITTSANISGRPPAVSANELDKKIVASCDIVLDGGRCPVGSPSAIARVDPQQEVLIPLREGKLDFRKLEKIFKKCFVKAK